MKTLELSLVDFPSAILRLKRFRIRLSTMKRCFRCSLIMVRLFKKQMHTSIVNYITGYRMQKAKELLKNPAIPVTVVASYTDAGRR